MTKKSYSTLTIAAAAAVLILLASSAAVADPQDVNNGSQQSSTPSAAQLQAEEDGLINIIHAPMCFLPRFTTAEKKQCLTRGYVVRRLEQDD